MNQLWAFDRARQILLERHRRMSVEELVVALRALLARDSYADGPPRVEVRVRQYRVATELEEDGTR